MLNVSKFRYTYSRHASFQVSENFCLRDSPISEDIYMLNGTIIFVFTGISYYQKKKLVSQYIKVMANVNRTITYISVWHSVHGLSRVLFAGWDFFVILL